MNPEARLAELGLTLPNPPAAAGSYVPTVRAGNLLFCAGTVCLWNGQMTHTGQVGREQTVQTANKSAEICVLNTLANVHQVRFNLKDTQDRYNRMASELQAKLNEKQAKCQEIEH